LCAHVHLCISFLMQRWTCREDRGVVGGGAAGRCHARAFVAARELTASDHDVAAKQSKSVSGRCR
jgi:hypothetical protein